MADTVLALLAHPDDAEFLCAGTLIRLVREHGWQAHVASMTPGDCGSAELPPEEIARVRREEGRRAAGLIGAAYHCLEERDLAVFYIFDISGAGGAYVYSCPSCKPAVLTIPSFYYYYFGAYDAV